MIILISPTKNMKEVKGSALTLPLFTSTSKKIMKELKRHSMNELVQLMKINEKLALLNIERFHRYFFDSHGTAAILAYQGLQYLQIKSECFNKDQKDYAQKHLRIFSGLYGVLRPYDSIYPYRLEMQCKLAVKDSCNLYELWTKQVSKHIAQQSEGDVIVNLASNEYRKSLDETLQGELLDIVFKVEKKGQLKVEATAAKMARGKMVRYMVEREIKRVKELQDFKEDGFQFVENLSDERMYIFVKKEVGK